MKDRIHHVLVFFLFAICSTRAFKLYMSSSAPVLKKPQTPSLATANSNNAIFKIFHPAFPLKLKDSISYDEAIHYLDIQSKFRASAIGAEDEPREVPAYKGLPWRVLPEIGLSGEKDTLSKKGIENAWEKSRHRGSLVWAYKLKYAEAGCFLLNHWKQQVVYVEEYDIATGARGYEVSLHSETPMNWPPLTLEREILERKWQPVQASENLKGKEITKMLPTKMSKSPWEIIFSLLISAETHPEMYQALYDTGLSPKQGLFAYMRLLDQILLRTEDLDDLPSYRKIFESDLNF